MLGSKTNVTQPLPQVALLIWQSQNAIIAIKSASQTEEDKAQKERRTKVDNSRSNKLLTFFSENQPECFWFSSGEPVASLLPLEDLYKNKTRFDKAVQENKERKKVDIVTPV